MSDYGYEIDFIPVGNGDKSGDAIAIRYGYPGNYKVMVVDGGTKESGQKLVDHIKLHYHTSHVNFLVNTHPDADHASGLEVVAEQLSVGEIWIHRPWLYADMLCRLFKDGRMTDNSLSDLLKTQLPHVYRLEEIANEKEIPIYEPYAGAKIGEFYVLSPQRSWYLQLIPHFNKTPDAKAQIFDAGIKQFGLDAARVYEHWDYETLQESGETSYENESSVILYANFVGRGVLLTGDAGIQALNNAADHAAKLSFNLAESQFIQMPHHGSRNNVSPSILNRILGPIVAKGSHLNKTVFVSASKESQTHPRKVVVNAFLRRGARVCATRGETICHSYNMPQREGWVASTPLTFNNYVEGN